MVAHNLFRSNENDLYPTPSKSPNPQNRSTTTTESPETRDFTPNIDTQTPLPPRLSGRKAEIGTFPCLA